MTRNLLATTAIVLAFGANAALADVTVTVDVTKTKDITVTETITKIKVVNVDVNAFPLNYDSAAEALAVVNARLTDGEVNGYQSEIEGGVDVTDNDLFDYNIFLSAVIDTSINGNSGIVGVNQDVGNLANQGNVVALSATGRPNGEGEVEGATSNPSLTHSMAALDQKNNNNRVFDSEFLSVPGDPTTSTPNKTALINGSINGNTGIVGVNQNAGNFVNQHNVVAFAVGFEGAVALSEANLGQLISGNTVKEIETIKFATITGSGNGNSGVVGINQNTGNMNNQASTVSISALTSPISVGIPFGG